MARAAVTISRSGRVIPWARSWMIASESAAAASPVAHGGRSSCWPIVTTRTVTPTAATITTPSFFLIDVRKSRGLTPAASQLVRAQGVADPVHGPDHVGADLPAKGADVRVDGPLADPVVVAPDLGQEPPAAEHDVRRLCQPVEEVELARRQVDEASVSADLAPGGLDLERPEPDRLLGRARMPL